MKLSDLYPESVIAAAKAQLAKKPRARRYRNIITADVVAVWRNWLDQGVPVFAIANKNGLAQLRSETVEKYMSYHPKARRDGKLPKPNEITDSLLRLANTAVPTLKPPKSKPAVAKTKPVETAVSPPEPAPEPIATAVADEIEETVVSEPTPETPPPGLPAFWERNGAARPTNPVGELVDALKQLQSVDGVRVRGKIRLELEIELE